MLGYAAAFQAFAAKSKEATESTPDAPITIGKAVLEGKELRPFPYPWPKAMVVRGYDSQKAQTIYAGQVVVGIYETNDGVLAFENQPYDEFVQVLHGTSILIPKDGKPHKYVVGDHFVVPKGFTGTWEARDSYRELIVIEASNYSDAAAKWFPEMHAVH